MTATFTTRGDARSLRQTDPGTACFPLAPFASLGFNVFAKDPKTMSVKDKRSGVIFDGEFCLKGGGNGCPRIAGTGVRSKKIAGIKSLDIYALALYVDEEGARRALHSKFGKLSPDTLAKTQALFDGTP
jgi:hypothetical protein